MRGDCTISDFVQLLEVSASMDDEILDLISKCGYVEITSHDSIRELLSEARRPGSPSLLILVYGEPGTGKSFFARTVQQELLAEARDSVRKAFENGSFSYVTLPVYVNLAKYPLGGTNDYAALVASISKIIASGILSALASVYGMMDVYPLMKVKEVWEKIKGGVEDPEFVPALVSLLRFGAFKYFIILDELSSLVGDLSREEDVDRFVRIILEGVAKQWKELLGNTLLGFMLILHAGEDVVESVMEGVEKRGSVLRVGGVERYRWEEISMTTGTLPISVEDVAKWLKVVGVDNEWVAKVYREIVARGKFRYACIFLKRYLIRGSSGTPHEVRKIISKELEWRVSEKLSKRKLGKPVKPQQVVGNLKCDILVGDSCVDIKVLGNPEDVVKEIGDDLQRIGSEAGKYRLFYVVVSSKPSRPSLANFPSYVSVVVVGVPGLEEIYEALKQTDEDIKIGDASQKAQLLSAMSLVSSIDLKGIFLDLLAEKVADMVENAVRGEWKGEYDYSLYAAVVEDCGELDGKSRSDWRKRSKSLRKALGRGLKSAEDVDVAVQRANDMLKGSGLRLEVRGSHVYCLEE